MKEWHVVIFGFDTVHSGFSPVWSTAVDCSAPCLWNLMPLKSDLHTISMVLLCKCPVRPYHFFAQNSNGFPPHWEYNLKASPRSTELSWTYQLHPHHPLELPPTLNTKPTPALGFAYAVPFPTPSHPLKAFLFIQVCSKATSSGVTYPNVTFPDHHISCRSSITIYPLPCFIVLSKCHYHTLDYFSNCLSIYLSCTLD